MSAGEHVRINLTALKGEETLQEETLSRTASI